MLLVACHLYVLLNYCNFELYLLIIFNVPIGRITKSHEEIPSVVSRDTNTLINIILSCVCPPREFGLVNFSGADLVEWIVKWTKEYILKWGSPHFYTHTLTCVAYRGEREIVVAARRRSISLGFYLLYFDHLYWWSFSCWVFPFRVFPW